MSSTNLNKNSKIKLHIEILRIFATFFVIFNHTNAFKYFENFEANTFGYWFFLTISVLCKVSVPLFFMISGALLLPKFDEKPQVLIKRILRIGFALLLFSFLSYLQQIDFGNEVFNLKRFITVIVESNWMSVFWYLYAYLAYLVTIPFMRVLAQHLKTQHYIYLIVLQLLFSGFIPITLYLLYQGQHHINSNFSINWVLGYYPIYPLVGYFLENKLDISKITKKRLGLLWIANILCVALTCYVTHYNNSLTGEFPQTYMMSLVLLNCITLYITAKKLAPLCKFEKLNNFVISIGRCTFGIYLFHGLLLRAPNISIWNRIARKSFFCQYES